MNDSNGLEKLMSDILIFAQDNFPEDTNEYSENIKECALNGY